MRSFALLTVAGLATAASASILNPGQSFETNPGTIPAESAPTGTVIATLTSPFTAGTFSGSLFTQVIQGDSTNPLGGLTFVYTLTNNAVSPDAINRLTITGWQGWSTDAAYDVTSAGVIPFDIDRSSNANVIGVDFQQDGTTVPLTPGTTGRRIVIQTNAPAFREVTANVIDGSVVSVTTYGPAVPAPAAAGLLALGALGAARRRR
jgi:MYXO-CTERM domain-containing protein